MPHDRPPSTRLLLSGPRAPAPPRMPETDDVTMGVKRLFAAILPGGLGGYRHFRNDALGFEATYDPTGRRVTITALSAPSPLEGAGSHDFMRFLHALDDHCQKHPAGWSRATRLSLLGCSPSERLSLNVGPARFRPR